MTEFKETELDERAIKMAKVLSADAVERAGHGHPGSPVSLAPIAYTLYQHFIKHDPNDPNWEGRDRFILSGGHASLTQYVQLYFSGYGVTLDDLKNFRGGADTRTPGHPEYGLTPGIETVKGDAHLQQNVKDAAHNVLFALSKSNLTNRYNSTAHVEQQPTWWRIAYIAAIAVSAVLTVVFAVLSARTGKKNSKKEA